MAIYDVNGNRIDQDIPEIDVFDYDVNVKSVNHRGFSNVAPENTLPAYILSKKNGYSYVETDISFTSDGVPMLLHDATIDRTSNGSGTLSQMTYAQVRQYDFGSWKSAEYTGTVIPTLSEFLILCKRIGLKPYIELKDNGEYTNAQIEQIVHTVWNHGMKENSTYISFSSAYLQVVKATDGEARLGFLKGAKANYSEDVTICNSLKTSSNKVFYDVRHDKITQEMVDAMSAENIPIEAWTVDDPSIVLSLNNYVSGVTTNSLNAGKILYDATMPHTT